MAETLAPLNDDELQQLEQWLDQIPAPMEPLDVMLLDGYLVGVLLQPQVVPLAQWFAHVLDVEGRPLPPGFDSEPLRALVRRRHAELNRAIADRQWFDPWIFELDEDAEPLETVMPWVAGFATAMDLFPRLMNEDPAAVLEPLAVLYRAFDPEDLEDADDLLEAIEELEPPQDLDEAVEALVSSTLLLADVTRPQAARPTARLAVRPGSGIPGRAGKKAPGARHAGGPGAPAGPGQRGSGRPGGGGGRGPAGGGGGRTGGGGAAGGGAGGGGPGRGGPAGGRGPRGGGAGR